MPCPPHPIEGLESACTTAENQCSGLRSAWEYLVPHVRDVLSIVKSPPGKMISLLELSIPDPLPDTPAFSGKPQELCGHGEALEAWLKDAEFVRKTLEDRVCMVRTLVIRLGDEVSDGPAALAARHKVVKIQHLHHRVRDRKTWLWNLRWALQQDSVTEVSAKQIKAQIQRLEQMDDATLLRVIPDEVETLT